MNTFLSENIKNLRLKAGFSQVEFAKRMGVTKQCVSNWENDNVIPSIDMLERLADFFKVTTDSLLGRNTQKLIDVSALSEEQSAHIRLLVNDFAEMNKKCR